MTQWQMETGIVVQNRLVALDVYHMRVLAPNVSAHGQAGQFVMVEAWQTEPLLPRAMAPVRFGSDGILDIYYRSLGLGTRLMASAPVSSTCTVIGPLGKPWVPVAGNGGLALVGRGVGITPLLPIAALSAASGCSVRSYLSARIPDLVVEIPAFEAYGPVSAHNDLDLPGVLVTDQLAKDLQDNWRPACVVVSGSRRLVSHVSRLKQRYGFHAKVFVEEKMACGIGYCKGCAVGLHRTLICVEGPCLPLEDIVS